LNGLPHAAAKATEAAAPEATEAATAASRRIAGTHTHGKSELDQGFQLPNVEAVRHHHVCGAANRAAASQQRKRAALTRRHGGGVAHILRRGDQTAWLGMSDSNRRIRPRAI
jgi:hypothetical protein